MNETSFKEEIVCPCCGHTERDSWEFTNDSGIFECCECGEDVFYERHIEVTYSTCVALEHIKIELHNRVNNLRERIEASNDGHPDIWVLPDGKVLSKNIVDEGSDLLILFHVLEKETWVSMQDNTNNEYYFTYIKNREMSAVQPKQNRMKLETLERCVGLLELWF